MSLVDELIVALLLVSFPVLDAASIADDKTVVDDKSVAKVLQTPTTVNLVDIPLEDALKQLAEVQEIEIMIDEESVDPIADQLWKPVTLRVKDQSLQSVLHSLFRRRGLTAVPLPGGTLQVTTVEEADKRIDTRRYDVRPLLAVDAAIEDRICDVVIRSTTGPWQEIVGPGGIIELIDGHLVVQQTGRVHREVASLIKKLTRRLIPEAAAPLSSGERNEQRLWKKVEQPMTVTWELIPLKDMVLYVARQSQVPMLIDNAGLHKVDVHNDSLVYAVGAQVPLGELLDEALSPLNSAWIIDDEYIQITSAQVAQERRFLRVYDVRDKLRRIDGEQIDAERIIRDVQNLSGTTPWEIRDGSGGRAEMLGPLLIVRHHQRALRSITEYMAIP